MNQFLDEEFPEKRSLADLAKDFGDPTEFLQSNSQWSLVASQVGRMIKGISLKPVDSSKDRKG